jgi:ankyrin repeat/BTB/POZ domain-containing protein 1
MDRQETDTIELVDDIRYYLGKRFWQRIGKMDPLFDGEEEDNDEDDMKDIYFKTHEKQHKQLLERIDELLENLKLEA